MKKVIYSMATVLVALLMLVGCKSNKDEVTEIKLNSTSTELEIGQIFQLKPTVSTSKNNPKHFPVSYSSSNKEVATVSKGGLITAVKEGTAKITASAGNKTAVCNVVVEKQTSTGEDMTFTAAFASYYGDYYRTKASSFDFYGVKGVKLNKEGEFSGTGFYVYLDLTAVENVKAIPAGTYTATKEMGETNTFQKGYIDVDDNGENAVYSSYVGVVENSEEKEKLPIEGGELQFSVSGYDYTISGTVIAKGKTYNVNYKGAVPTADFVTPDPATLTKAHLVYYGDVDEGKKAGLFTLYLGDETADVISFKGGNDRMSLDFGVALDKVDINNVDILNGTYDVVATKEVLSNKITAGYIKEDYSEALGSWYFTQDRLAISQGSVTVKKENDTYTFTYDLKDDLGHEIKGSWQGELTIEDASTVPDDVSVVPVQRVKRSGKKGLNLIARKGGNLKR